MRQGLVVLMAVALALFASAIGGASAGAEMVSDAEPVAYTSPGSFPDIASPAAAEEYGYRLEDLAPTDTVSQVSADEIVVFNEEGTPLFGIHRGLAHAADGATVPTTLRLEEEDLVVLTVHHREGNPAAGGAPFAYPITGGPGWEGGFRTISGEMNEPKPPAPTPEPAPPAPTPCTVPSLHGLSLKSAKARLRAAHCVVGQVRLAAGATAGKGKVVKQFHPAGTQLGAGAAVAVKLGAG
jgi:hypothetical protein